MRALVLKSWRTDITHKSIVLTTFSFGIILLTSGLCFKFFMRNMHSYKVRYDNQCPNTSAPCTVNIEVKSEMRGKIALLYQLTNFYQNHRRMFNSKSYPQLAGRYAQGSDLANCQPMTYLNGDETPENLLIPCGLMAWSFFTDYYRFLNTSTAIFNDTGISVKSDRDSLFKPVSSQYKTGIRHLQEHPDFPGETINEHFIVWMRAAAMPHFLKLFAKCDNCVLPPGNYSIEVKMNYPKSMHSGPRYLILSETSIIGGASPFLHISYLSLSGVAFSLGLIFVIHLLFMTRRVDLSWPDHVPGTETGLKDSLLEESTDADANQTLVY